MAGPQSSRPTDQTRKSAQSSHELAGPFLWMMNSPPSTCFALDIGGTLCKIAIFDPCPNSQPVSCQDPSLDQASTVVLPGLGCLHFRYFETWMIEKFLQSKVNYSPTSSNRIIGITGGGARKFGEQLGNISGLQMCRADELTSLVMGIDFLSRHAQRVLFKYPKGLYEGGRIQKPFLASGKGKQDMSNGLNGRKRDYFPEVPVSLQVAGGHKESLYPYLVVNIGSGVSMLKVSSSTDIKRVGGTSLGGSTFLALAMELAGCKSFQETIDLAMEGDSSEIDMLVGDIYGGNYSEMGLAATTIACSFGKLVRPKWRSAAKKSRHNMVKALMLMITNEIAHLACLYADKSSVTNIVFSGGFLHGNQLAMIFLATAVEFRSGGSKDAMFLSHASHLGAIGALVHAFNFIDPAA